MGKVIDFLGEVARDLRPALEAGREDAARALTRMTLDGPSLAGEAAAPAAAAAGPGPAEATAVEVSAVVQWQELAHAAGEPMSAREAAEADAGYRDWLAERAAAQAQPQPERQMEIG